MTEYNKSWIIILLKTIYSSKKEKTNEYELKFELK
jgi:hypothetical protein